MPLSNSDTFLTANIVVFVKSQNICTLIWIMNGIRNHKSLVKEIGSLASKSVQISGSS